MTRWEIRAQVSAGRWRLLGDQSVQLGNQETTELGHQWAAVFQGGERACLDGASSLVASGLKRYTVERVRVSVPRGARVRRTSEYDIRQTRRWDPADVVTIGIPRTRTAVAAVRAGLWAKSDKQASLVITMAVQQGVTRAEDVATQMLRIRKAPRRLFLHALVNDLLDGARSLGELDIVRELRRRGLPQPERQVLRKDRRGRYYLDLYWTDYKLVVEIDGIHHGWAENVIGDALRQNSLALDATRC